MSHFTLLVIDTEGYTDIEDVLEPFDENLEIDFIDRTSEVEEDWENMSDDEKSKYESISEFAYNHQGYIEEDGKFGYWRNDNAHYDWFQVGGRWDKMIPLKDGEMVNSAYIKDVDMDKFTCDLELFKGAERFWDLKVNGAKPETEDEKRAMMFSFESKEYFLERYKTKENYAKISAKFSTFAVLLDGQWFEKGEMGWFGMSSETTDEANDWDNNYFEKFIANLPEDAYITVVDCHI